MSVVPSSGSRAHAEWYFVHSLAALTTLVVVYLFGSLGYFAYTGSPTQIPPMLRPVLAVGAVTLLWFWIRMLIDFFRRRPSSTPVAWGFALVLGVYLGALAYFWYVWRPRNQVRDA